MSAPVNKVASIFGITFSTKLSILNPFVVILLVDNDKPAVISVISFDVITTFGTLRKEY